MWGPATLVCIGSCAAPAERSAHETESAARVGVPARVLPVSETDSLLRLGDAMYRQKPESARVLWTAALALARSQRDSAAIARLLTGLGQVARNLGEFADARRLGEGALSLKLQLGMQRDLFRSYNALGLLAWDEGRLADASRLLDSAASVARQTNDSVSLAKATLNQGLVLQDLGAFQGARAAFERSRDAARRAADSVTMARAFNNIAALDVQLGDPASAIAGLEEARRLARASADSVTEVNARGQLATAYIALGEPQRAFALLDSAVHMAQRDGRRLEAAEDLKLRGDLFADAGDHRHALEDYRRARSLADTVGLEELRGVILRREAVSLASLGNNLSALQRAGEALQLHRREGHRWPTLSALLVVAELEGRAGRPSEADGYLRAAGRLADSLAIPIAHARVAIAESHVLAERGDWGGALRALERVRGAPELGEAAAEAEVLALRARAHAALGQLEAAAVAGRGAIAAVERIRGNYASGELRTTYVAEKSEVYADQTLLLLRMGRTDEAFQVADAARGRALVEHLVAARGDVPATGVVRDALERERLLRRIDALVARLQARAPAAPRERTAGYEVVSAGLADSVRAARTEYEALLARDAARTLPSAALIGVARARARDIAKVLARDEVLLEYFVAPKRLLIFVVTSSGVAAHPVEVDESTLAARVRLARDLAQLPARASHAMPVLRALYAQLLAPVVASGALRGVRRLVVVPHAVLTYLPFAALVDPNSGRYVVEDFVLSHAPTAASFVAMRRERGDEVGGSGEPPHVAAFAPFPAELRATRDEVMGISNLALTGAATVGEAATEHAVREALASGAVVHLATHARMNPVNPLFSRIELAGDPTGPRGDNGRLEVHELLGMHLGNPLVFLSGCETALGRAWATGYDSGEDYTTIAQVLLYSGARTVVATLWRIDDRGAGDFARRFYGAEWRADAAGAVAAAQRAMLSDERYRSPYFWAAYQASGGTGASRARPSVQ